MPTQKVSVGAFAGAISLVAVWCLNTYAHAQITTEVGMAVTTILTFATQYLVKD